MTGETVFVPGTDRCDEAVCDGVDDEAVCDGVDDVAVFRTVVITAVGHGATAAGLVVEMRFVVGAVGADAGRTVGVVNRINVTAALGADVGMTTVIAIRGDESGSLVGERSSETLLSTDPETEATAKLSVAKSALLSAWRADGAGIAGARDPELSDRSDAAAPQP